MFEVADKREEPAWRKREVSIITLLRLNIPYVILHKLADCHWYDSHCACTLVIGEVVYDTILVIRMILSRIVERSREIMRNINQNVGVQTLIKPKTNILISNNALSCYGTR